MEIKWSKHAKLRSRTRKLKIQEKDLLKASKKSPMGQSRVIIDSKIFVIEKHKKHILVITVYWNYELSKTRDSIQKRKRLKIKKYKSEKRLNEKW